MSEDSFAQIYVDVHESDSGIATDLKRLDEVIVQRPLETGDILIKYKGYIIGVEMKRGHDYEKSLYEGRLHDQICRLYDNYNMPILIIEGHEVRGNPDVHKTINTMNLRVPTFQTYSQEETVELIAEFVRKLKSGKLNFLKRPVIIEDDLDPRIKLLCSLPNVSKARAEKILYHYGTVKNAIANLDNWHKLKIGLTADRTKRIKAIWEIE